MRVTQHSVFRRFWYPVMPLHNLATGPQSFTLLSQPLALWLDHKGHPHAVEDRCCHRTARLSLGRVQGDAIQCPYHGWQFDGSGVCVKVPQLGPGPIPPSYRIRSFGCGSRYGYVWVCLDPPALQPMPEIPEAEDPSFRQIHEFDETWRCSGLRFMENSFDSAHPHFVHGQGQTHGDPANPVPPPLDEVTELEDGILVRHWMEVLNPDIQKQNLNITADKTIRTNVRRWFAPFSRTLQITYPNGLVHLIFSAMAPIDDQQSRLIQFCLRNDREEDAPAAGVIAYDRQVTQEDRLILETTEFDTPLSLVAEEHMASDKPGILMRRQLMSLIKIYG